MKKIILLSLFGLVCLAGCHRRIKPVSPRPMPPKPVVKQKPVPPQPDTLLHVGAEQLGLYLPGLQGKNVALVVNHTSMVGKTHLVDTLLRLGIKIRKIFAPEHGFRGEADAGEKIQSSTDTRTGLPLVSLYGKNRKPMPEQLSDIEIVIFDIQDAGTRFYTYISTMHYVMEACAEQNKKMLILDRPNPNGNYVDGMVLNLKFKSFVGMHPIPVVHGLTVGELATMINGEGWLTGGVKTNLDVIPVKNYSHRKSYILPVRPSPNLPNQQAVLLYPSLCFFEGTRLSVGRGTPFPFQVVGGLFPQYGSFAFIPQATPGAAQPVHRHKTCYGIDLQNVHIQGFTLKYLLEMYRLSPEKKTFFNTYFDTLAGGSDLREHIIAGKTETQIRESWQPELDNFKNLRKKYLLYGE
jgi:uncharacterized protein YbbC (DUF1343 family)